MTPITQEQALERVKVYLERKSKQRSEDREIIHSYDGATYLLVSDLRALLDATQQAPAPMPSRHDIEMAILGRTAPKAADAVLDLIHKTQERGYSGDS